MTLTAWLIVAIVILVLLCLVLAVLATPTILALLLRPALLCVDGGSRYWKHVVTAVVAWVADLVAARTTWPALAGELQEGEKTISDSLERLIHDREHPNHLQLVAVARYIDRVSPGHIKTLKALP